MTLASGKISHPDAIARQQAVLARNIERVRSMPFPLIGKYIVVNIPAFELQAWENGRLVMTSPVIVGRPARKTPLMISDLYAVKYNPDWSVPSTIRKEYLEYLRAGRFGELHRHGVVVKVPKVDPLDPAPAKTLPVEAVTAEEFIAKGYRFWQPPSESNALGVLKFELDNNQSIYLHDTNERGKFSRSKRALSSGCVRVMRYRDLAAWVSDLPMDEIQSRIATRKTMIRRVDRIPVFLAYFTALPDPLTGKIKFYSDIYGYDRLPVDPPTWVAPPPVVEPIDPIPPPQPLGQSATPLPPFNIPN